MTARASETRRRGLSAAALAFVALAALGVRSSLERGTLCSRVVDEDGVGLGGAHVSTPPSDDTVVTDGAGGFCIHHAGAADGPLRVAAAKRGYEPAEHVYIAGTSIGGVLRLVRRRGPQ